MKEATGSATERVSSAPSDSARTEPGRSPFQKARSLPKRLKLFLWGDSGVGKTTLALQFPSPVAKDSCSMDRLSHTACKLPGKE